MIWVVLNFLVAQVQLIQISPYLNKVIYQNQNELIIFAGSTGNPCTGTGQWPCNSCNKAIPLAGASLPPFGLVCNNRQIYPSLKFVVSLKSNQAQHYVGNCSSLILAKDGNTNLVPESLTPYEPNKPNQIVTATWSWGTFCGILGQDSNCQKSFRRSIQVGFNANCDGNTLEAGSFTIEIRYRYVKSSPPMSFGCPSNMGLFEAVCDYTVFPGDKKFFIINVGANLASNLTAGDQQNAVTPTMATQSDPSGIKYHRLRIFFAEGGFNQIYMNSQFVDLPFADNVGLLSSRIEKVLNGVRYSAIAANVDEAGNVELFAYPLNPNNSIPMSDSVTPLGETQATEPTPVIGAFHNDQCFIATELLGPRDPGLKALRRFRDRFLRQVPGGNKLINWYYNHSPEWVVWIRQHPMVKRWLQILMRPIVWVLTPLMAQTQESPWPDSDQFRKAMEDMSHQDRISHPLESFGLKFIDADDQYYFSVDPQWGDRTLSFGIEFMSELDVLTRKTQLSNLYDLTDLIFVNLFYSPQSFRKRKLGYFMEASLALINGFGVLEKYGSLSQERYNLLMSPMGIGAQYYQGFGQSWAFFVRVGVNLFNFLEIRDDWSQGNLGFRAAVKGVIGFETSLIKWSPTLAQEFQSDFSLSDLRIFSQILFWQPLQNSFMLPNWTWSIGLGGEI